MAAISSVRPASPNRRRRVRHKIQTPAYASFIAESKSAMLDLYEIVDISEDGIAIRCPSPLETDKRFNLCLDLADCPDHVYTAGRVVWTDSSGRVGFHFSELPPASLFRLREWLFLNAIAGVANAEAEAAASPVAREHIPARPSYTDTLAAVTAVQREVEALGSDLTAALQLVAVRAQSLVRASGAAIALATDDPDFMECRASSGADAPPIGVRLHVGSGFSGVCVKTGSVMRCDDSELDPRVDRESCRALGIRSILAVPVRVGEKSIGILEAFSPQPDTFTEDDGRVLQRLTETVLAAFNRAARAENLPELTPEPSADRFAPAPGSVLFADAGEEEDTPAGKTSGGISLPRSYLILLVGFAALIFAGLGYLLAPFLQSKLEKRNPAQLETVLASSQPPKSEKHAPTADNSVETASFEQLRQMANEGDPKAQNTLGLRYANGVDVKLDEIEAVRWFTKAAEQGNVAAQAKLGTIYFSGRGVPQDLEQAYFWMVLGRLGGDDASKALAPFVRDRLTRARVTAIELDADRWLEQHRITTKPTAGH